MRVDPTPTTDSASAAREDLTGYFLNAYEIANAHELRWPVRLYVVDPIDGSQPVHSARGGMVGAMWQLRRRHGSRCKGSGYITDVDERRVAVPSSWNLPSDVEIEGHRVTFQNSLTANASNLQHRAIILGILKEAIKKHFKSEASLELGTLWQDYRDFCEMPPETTEGRFCFCRRFCVTPVIMDHFLALRLEVTTTVLDGRTLHWYYYRGKVEALARMIRSKRENRMTRTGETPAVRVWYDQRTDGLCAAKVVELESPELIVHHAGLAQDDQVALACGNVTCRQFAKAPEEIPLDRVRLILDTQDTKEEHAETIIDPSTRSSYARELRSFLQGMDVYGQKLRLKLTPLSANRFTVKCFLPPAICVRSSDGAESIVAPPAEFTTCSLRERARLRATRVRQHGFLRQRPINPVLAWPQKYAKIGLSRMVNDVNRLLRRRGLDYRFSGCLYDDVEDLRKKVEHGAFDTLLAVLPERSSELLDDHDTHDKIKRRIPIPSQCIHIDNTLPKKWVRQSPQKLKAEDRALWKAIQNKYGLCVDNLLVKHGWIPFAPAAPFHYNVHVGLDVGGRGNDTAVACVGHGFSHPDKELVFRLQRIPIDIAKAEPIPPRSLASGLLQLFEYVASELGDLGLEANFDSTLFIRDGAVLGHGDAWNEGDAFELLHNACLDRGIISAHSTWTIAEVLKRAEGWRLFANEQTPQNPLVGYCLMDFDGPNGALLCTTGRPYLTQGSAQPLKVRVSIVHGTSTVEDVIRDLVWEADMGFTKPDMGRGLPWVLHVANTGALQMSRSYRISGITA